MGEEDELAVGGVLEQQADDADVLIGAEAAGGGEAAAEVGDDGVVDGDGQGIL